MLEPALVEYIKQEKQHGTPVSAIKATLLEQGWPASDVDQAVQLVGTPADTNRQIQPKTPILIIIIAWLLLFEGIITLFSVLPFFLLGGFVQGFLVLAVINLVKGIGLVAVSFGLRKMRKWSLYALMVLVILNLLTDLYAFATHAEITSQELFVIGFELLITIYLWTNAKKFI